ncbi:hypothetical protein ZEAMMB73_Zm00001d034450, partial [Zea mays]
MEVCDLRKVPDAAARATLDRVSNQAANRLIGEGRGAAAGVLEGTTSGVVYMEKTVEDAEGTASVVRAMSEKFDLLI